MGCSPHSEVGDTESSFLETVTELLKSVSMSKGSSWHTCELTLFYYLFPNDAFPSLKSSFLIFAFTFLFVIVLV